MSTLGYYPHADRDQGRNFQLQGTAEFDILPSGLSFRQFGPSWQQGLSHAFHTKVNSDVGIFQNTRRRVEGTTFILIAVRSPEFFN